MTRNQKMGQSEVRDFDSFFFQTLMCSTIGANWTRVITIFCCWQFFSLAKQRVLTSDSFEKRLEMSSVQIVETSVANNSPSQVSSHPNDHFQSRD